MAIANQIAQLGMNTGRDIQNTVANRIAEYGADKRYKEQMGLQRSKLAMMENQALQNTERYNEQQRNQLAFQERQARQEQDEKERKYVANAFKYLSGLPEQDRPNAWREFISSGSRQGIDMTGVPTEYDKSHLQRLAFEGGEVPEPTGNKSMFTDETTMRKEFEKSSGEYKKQEDAMGRIVASSREPSPAGDLSLIFNYMKILDPGSVVRESEFATAAATGSFGDTVKAAVEKVISGKRLSNTQRRDFIKKAMDQYRESRTNYSKRSELFGGLADAYGFDKTHVVPYQPIYSDDTLNKHYSMLPSDDNPPDSPAGYSYNPQTGELEKR